MPVTPKEEEGKFESWAILELMGHRKLGGFVQETQIGGAPFIRIDVPKRGAAEGSKDWIATQFYSPASVYALTPCSEKAARGLAAANQPEPVTRWELPAETRPSMSETVYEDEERGETDP